MVASVGAGMGAVMGASLGVAVGAAGRAAKGTKGGRGSTVGWIGGGGLGWLGNKRVDSCLVMSLPSRWMIPEAGVWSVRFALCMSESCRIGRGCEEKLL
jgi:hypothetical protein